MELSLEMPQLKSKPYKLYALLSKDLSILFFSMTYIISLLASLGDVALEGPRGWGWLLYKIISSINIFVGKKFNDFYEIEINVLMVFIKH